ncbi:hypothetical protein PVAND_014984 [Polypedilum vanderplanki]|uniref:Uncharacterized protein n=1 Tax=Polypedilum vanderplanki TaxID=319348 RepID=A0A9J6BBA5_POLVA|nr:hypothetical protein PVAND_014984 [Polypedilum vanderplanki]
MRFHLLIFLTILISSISTQETVEVLCDFQIYNGNMNVDLRDQYNCYLDGVDIINSTTPIIIKGEHLEGRTNANVTMIRTPNYTQKLVNLQVVHPQFFIEFPNLEELVFAYASVKTLNFENCTKLTRIYLHHDDIQEIPRQVFSNCENLRHLDFGFNPIQITYQDSFIGLKSLEILSFKGNTRVDIFTNSLADSENLREFYFIGNGTIEVGALSNMKSLEILEISQNGLQFSQVQNLLNADVHKLERLVLDENFLTSVPVGAFDGFSSLTYLSLDNNWIAALDGNSLRGLSNLRTLWLSGNAIGSLNSHQFRHLNELTELHLSFNPQQSLASDIFNNTKLQLLNLVGCKLKSIEVKTFEPLEQQQLNLDFNQLQILPVDIFAIHSKLEFLSLTKNSINSLSLSSFGNLTQLTTLLVNENQIKEIEPKLFEKFPKLNYFGATGNECIKKSIEKFNENEDLNECHENWENERTITTTANGNKLKIEMILIFIAIIFINLMRN